MMRKLIAAVEKSVRSLNATVSARTSEAKIIVSISLVFPFMSIVVNVLIFYKTIEWGSMLLIIEMYLNGLVLIGLC